MGRSKKKGGKKKGGGSGEQEDWDDAKSEASYATASTFYDEDENGLSNYEDNPLEYISEALYEKRTATREKVRPECAVSAFVALLILTDKVHRVSEPQMILLSSDHPAGLVYLVIRVSIFSHCFEKLSTTNTGTPFWTSFQTGTDAAIDVRF